MLGKKIKLFKIFGFEVGIDISWIILAILVAWSLSAGLFPAQYKDLPAQTYWIMGIIATMGLFLSIIFHELSHSLVARKYGMAMRGITLFIFGGIAEMGEEPQSPGAEFKMAVAGPLSSIFIGLLFLGAYRLGLENGWPQPVNGVLQYLAMINGLLAAFNLVPAFPLDGGRMLRSALWKWKQNLRWATRISSKIGSGFGILLILLGIFQFFSGNFIGGMWLFLIGMFIRGAAKMSYQQLMTRRALEGEPVQRFMKSDVVAVTPSLPVDRLVDEYIYKYHYKMFPVVEGSGRLAGCVTTKKVKDIPKEEWSGTRVNDITDKCAAENTIGPEDDAIKALSLMSRTGASRLLVAEQDHLLGVLTLKDLLKFLSLKVELEEA